MRTMFGWTGLVGASERNERFDQAGQPQRHLRTDAHQLRTTVSPSHGNIGAVQPKL